MKMQLIYIQHLRQISSQLFLFVTAHLQCAFRDGVLAFHATSLPPILVWTVLPKNPKLRLSDAESLDALVVARAKAADAINCGGREGRNSSTLSETMLVMTNEQQERQYRSVDKFLPLACSLLDARARQYHQNGSQGLA